MPKHEQEKKFYVAVNNPSNLRKGILECSKNVIRALQQYEKSKETRREKIEKIFEVRRLIRDIKRDILLVNSKLPELPREKKLSIRRRIGEEVVDLDIKKEIERVKPAELRRLEEDLKSIEHELSKLTS